jgi:hypothetical protein
MGTWMNNDGLFIKYGDDEGRAGKAGQFAEGGAGVHVIQFDLTMSTLVASGGSSAIVDDNVFVPAGYRVVRVETQALTVVASSGGGTLDVGLIRRDRSTELDYNGFVAAAAVASLDAANETNTYNIVSGAGGALIGTTLANSGYITANYGTAVFQSGLVRVRIYLAKL